MTGPHTHDSKESTGKLSGLVNEFSKSSGHKTNTQNSVVFLDISNDRPEDEEDSPIKIAKKPPLGKKSNPGSVGRVR